MDLPKLGPDLQVKMFNDLDKVLFHGDLKRRVILRWADTGECFERVGPGYGPGEGPGAMTIEAGTDGQPRIHIRMNAIAAQLPYPHGPPMADRNAFYIGVVVHEMVHAWFFVHCGLRGPGSPGFVDPALGPGQDPHHGYYFYDPAKCVIERMARCLQRDDINRALARAFPARQIGHASSMRPPHHAFPPTHPTGGGSSDCVVQWSRLVQCSCRGWSQLCSLENAVLKSLHEHLSLS